MLELSPTKRRNKELTNLEMEAQALVHEDVPGPKVSDEEKYAEMLEQRKQIKQEENAKKEARKVKREERKKERPEQLKQKQKDKEEKKYNENSRRKN